MRAKRHTWIAPLHVGGAWRWYRFASSHACRQAAVLEKAREVNADHWNFDQAREAGAGDGAL